MKAIAMYLPQFHRVPENDTWWGEGFTDWVAVKAARPLFKEHEQPKMPFDEKYYDLLDKGTMLWQAELMKKYDVDGMCIYHYWFKDGKRILEKPEQNLLQWKDVEMPFCFCWANETWARSWTHLSSEKNTWADTFEPQIDNTTTSNGILLKQEYGDEDAWREHFFYLLPYFMDKRYLRKDGKPVFLIHRASNVECLSEMIMVWRQLALESGLPGIYVIGGECQREYKGVLDGQLYQEPQHAMKHVTISTVDGIRRISYQYIWEEILNTEHRYETQPYFGGFVGYDDTPRRGAEGTAIVNENAEIFRDSLIQLIKKNEEYGADYLFINAWNEWGEGMYLEPDNKYEYAFLESVRDAKRLALLPEDPNKRTFNPKQENAKNFQELIDRININLITLDRWLMLSEFNISVASYVGNLLDGELYIYGYGVLGKHLLLELEKNNITVSGIIERDTAKVHANTPVIPMGSKFLHTDVIIVTAIYDFEEITSNLEKAGAAHIFSIENIILACLKENNL